jgi:uncharacterized protein YutE (UPF0331/DUF86 family)
MYRLGLHLLADFTHPLPETNRAVFTALAAEDVIDSKLAKRLEKMAGFRNLLVHGYADLIARLVHANLADLPDMRAYVRAIEPELRARGGFSDT